MLDYAFLEVYHVPKGDKGLMKGIKNMMSSDKKAEQKVESIPL